MAKEKVVVIGTGERYYKMWPTITHNYDVVAALDNNVRGNIKGIDIEGVSEITKYSYDKVLVLPVNYMFEIKEQLLEMGVPADKIIPYFGENISLKTTDYKYVNDKILFDNGTIRFELDKDSGHGGVNGIFFDHVYNWGGAEDSIVIDIGANIGLSSLFFAARKNVTKVIGYEPLRSTYQKALHNINLNKTEIKDKINIYNLALGNANDEKIVNCTPQNARTVFSICTDQCDFNKNVEKIYVRKASEILTPIFQEYHDKKIVVKMDCEGSEYAIFESMMQADIVRDVDIFMIEFHLQDKGIIEDCLIKNGFRYIKTNTADYIGFVYAFNIKKG